MVDAEAAARAALGGTATGTPKSQDGKVEAIRVLRLARRSAMKARTQAANQIQAIIQAAPPSLGEPLRGLSFTKLIPIARRLRWRGPITPLSAAKLTLKGLADRWAGLDAEIRQLDDQLESLVEDAAPRLIALPGVGSETGGALLVAIGDNPDRLHSEAAFAALCGASPVWRIVRASATPSSEPWWQPGRKPRTMGDRDVSHGQGRDDTSLRREAHKTRPEQA